MPKRISKKDKRGSSKKESVLNAVKALSKLACPYCKAKRTPHLSLTQELAEFITDRGKILSRAKSGVCSKHQRLLAKEIKKARYLAFLPFVVKPE